MGHCRLIAVSPHWLCWWDGLRCTHHLSCPLPPLPSPLSLAPPLPVASYRDHSLPPSWFIVISLIAGGARAMILSSLLLGFVARVPFPPSSPSPFTSLACPSIACHVLLGHHHQLIVIFKGRWSERCWMGGGGFGVSVCEKLQAMLFLNVCTISWPGTIYKTNCFIQTTICMSQRYGQSHFPKEPISAPIMCTHPLILVMACWCQKWQKRVSLAVLQTLDGRRWKPDWVVIGLIGSWLTQKKSEKQRIFSNNCQTKFSPLPPFFFPT